MLRGGTDLYFVLLVDSWSRTAPFLTNAPDSTTIHERVTADAASTPITYPADGRDTEFLEAAELNSSEE